MRCDAELWDAFARRLRRDASAALAISRRHDARSRYIVPAHRQPRLLHALEIRNDSFRDERFIALLQRHGIALVVADTAGRWRNLEYVTADIVYPRPLRQQ